MFAQTRLETKLIPVSSAKPASDLSSLPALGIARTYRSLGKPEQCRCTKPRSGHLRDGVPKSLKTRYDSWSNPERFRCSDGSKSAQNSNNLGICATMATAQDILPETVAPEQRAVILHDRGPMVVIAGPGAGKTEVMLRRAAYLICVRGVEPEALLLTTFTRKAAAELKLRLARFLGPDADRVFISTIHGFCQWLLETYPQAHAFGPYPQVLDERGQYLFILSHLKDLGIGRGKGKLGDSLSEVIAAFNAYSEELVDPARLVEARRASGDDPEDVTVAEAYTRYRDLLVAARLLDFAGLQREAHRVLSDNSTVRDEVQSRFDYVMVDEYQDTNVIQDRILSLVAAPEYNLCVVGDDDQSIYRFRGATVQNFLNFPSAFPTARQVVLSRNFRSTEPILGFASRLIAHNPVRYAKALVAHRGTGPEVLLVTARDVDDEGQALAELVGELFRGGIIERWTDVAVLFSSVKHYASPLLSGLAERGIPFTVTGDGRFFDRPDIQQLMDVVVSLGWPNYWRTEMLDGPVLALSPITREILVGYDGDLWKLDEAGLVNLGISDARDLRVLAGLTALHRKVQHKEHASIVGLVHEILAISGYLADRLRAGDATAVLNVAQFTQLAADFDRHGSSRSPYRFGEYLWSLPERSLDERRPPADDAVQIMTIHQAKGLEFPVVLIASLIEGRLPNRERKRRFLIPDELAPEVMPPEIAERRRPVEPETHIPDQRRLFYVALNRARDLLVVSTSEKVRQQRCKPSRFLAEMELAPAQSRLPWGPVESSASRPSNEPRIQLSFSAINAYLTCPLRYRLAYEDELAVPTWYFVQFGASLHRTLEAIHRRALRGEPVDDRAAAMLLDQHWVPFGSRSPEAEERLKATAREYIARYVRHYASSFSRIREVELVFSAETGSALVSGRVDLVREAEDGSLEIVDFKTRASGGLALTHADLQLHLYALACEDRLDGRIGHVTVHLLADNVEERFPWNDRARQGVQETLDRVVAGIASRDFRPAPGVHCQVCEFRQLCPYGEA